jgi:hypothetical protein
VKPEPQVLPELRELQGLKAHKVTKVFRVFKGILVLLEPQVLLALRGRKASKVRQAYRGQQGPRVQQGLQGLRGRQELLAPELQQVVLLVSSLQRILQPIMTLHGQTPLTEALINHG